MSCLQLPRLYFFGTFRAAPSTINNIRANWSPNWPVPLSQLFGPRNIGENAPSGLSAAYQSQLTNSVGGS